MENEANNENVMAVLRGDGPQTILSLRDETLDQDTFAEYTDFAEVMWLHAHLQGKMCSSTTSVGLDIDDLVSLIENLRDLTSLRTLQATWAPYDRTVEIRLSVQTQKMGPPVACDVCLRNAISVQEEHHCRFETNLPWIAAFLADIERMAFRYRRARVIFGHGRFDERSDS